MFNRLAPSQGLACLCVVATAVLAGCATRQPRETVSASSSACPPNWSYTGNTGPADWATMTNGYPLCAGTTQSPVNIVAYTTADLPNILSDYDAAALIVQNTSRTFEVASSQFGSMTLNGTTWALSQFHFHAPSEHTLNGVSFGAELHLVHTNASGAIAVIGVLIQEASKDNPALDGIIAALPSAACTNSPQSGTIDPTSLLSPDMDYFQYSGSLTTPPCSPNVSWFVMKQPITASAAQIRALGALSANNRPAQSNLNAIVLKGPR